MSRLIDTMRAECERVRRNADGYRLAGARDLSRRCYQTASALSEAIGHLEGLAAAELTARRVTEVE